MLILFFFSHHRNGPSEFTVIGTLKEWSIIDRLPHIEAATLAINGQFDEAQDCGLWPFFLKIRRAKWVTIDGASHMSFVEQPERYLDVVGGFLTESDDGDQAEEVKKADTEGKQEKVDEKAEEKKDEQATAQDQTLDAGAKENIIKTPDVAA